MFRGWDFPEKVNRESMKHTPKYNLSLLVKRLIWSDLLSPILLKFFHAQMKERLVGKVFRNLFYESMPWIFLQLSSPNLSIQIMYLKHSLNRQYDSGNHQRVSEQDFSDFSCKLLRRSCPLFLSSKDLKISTLHLLPIFLPILLSPSPDLSCLPPRTLLLMVNPSSPPS